jgi:hypothetical protein
MSICEKLSLDKNIVIKKFSSEINSQFAVLQSILEDSPKEKEESVSEGFPKIAVIVILVVIAILFIANKVLSGNSKEQLAPKAPSVPKELAIPVVDSIENVPEDSIAENTQTDKVDTVPELRTIETPLSEYVLRFECTPSPTDRTCGVNLRGYDMKMKYFTSEITRKISRRDTALITITVPDRTRLFMNSKELKYGKYNTLFFNNGEIVGKTNRDLR